MARNQVSSQVMDAAWDVTPLCKGPWLKGTVGTNARNWTLIRNLEPEELAFGSAAGS
jgi:hypothetical protein